MSLEKKINEEISKHRYSPFDLDQLHSISKSNQEIVDLFREFATNENLFRLLTLHRLDLFGFETEVKIPYFLYCNLPKSSINKNNSNVSSALKFIISEKIESVEEKGLKLFENVVGEASNIEEDFKDIITFMLIDYLRNNSVLLQLANGNEFNYQIMKQAVKDYNGTVKLKKHFDERFQQYFEGDTIDLEIKKKIEKVVLHLVSNFMSKVDSTLENFQQMFPDMTLYFHKQSIIWLSSILDISEMEISEYTKCLDTMFRVRAINNKHIVTWCEHCNKYEPSFEIVTGKIAPSNLESKRTCLQCGNKKNYSFSAIYGLTQPLKDILNSKDGILATYFTCLLEKSGLNFEGSKYAGVYETDILVNKKHLIECKLLRINKDKNAVEINIKKAFTQLENQIKKYADEGVKIEKAFLLWNLEVEDKDFAATLDISHKELRNKYGLKIYPYYQINELINSLRS